MESNEAAPVAGLKRRSLAIPSRCRPHSPIVAAATAVLGGEAVRGEPNHVLRKKRRR
jgi:hypothetical protein